VLPKQDSPVRLLLQLGLDRTPVQPELVLCIEASCDCLRELRSELDVLARRRGFGLSSEMHCKERGV
jgi:hypothetical protein